MNSKETVILYINIVVLLLIPAAVHSSWEGEYVTTSEGGPPSYTTVKLPPGSPVEEKRVINPDPERRWYWIGPVTNTLPFAFLALLCLAHCHHLQSESRMAAYCGAGAAWLSMMGRTVYIISQYRMPHLSSTIAIAAMLTPFFYLPFLIVPYAFGATAVALWHKWDKWKDGQWERRQK